MPAPKRNYKEIVKVSFFDSLKFNAKKFPRLIGEKFKVVAEWRGFEPPRPYDPNDLANRPLQPLEYHSLKDFVSISHYL